MADERIREIDTSADTAQPSRRDLLNLAAGAGAAALAVGLAAGETRTAQAQTMGPTTIPRGSVSLAGAHMMLMAAEAKAREIGVPMSIVIVDEGGHLKAAMRMDGNGHGGIEIVMRKAQTSAGFGNATGAMGQAVFGGDPARAASFVNLPNIWLGGGGLPIRKDGMLIGGIGVGGGTPEQDIVVAQAGVDALM